MFTDLLKDYDGKALPFGQLQIEIHAWADWFPTSQKMLAWWEALEEAGLRPFMNEPNLVYFNYNRDKAPELQEVCGLLMRSSASLRTTAQYSFINIKGSHALLV